MFKPIIALMAVLALVAITTVPAIAVNVSIHDDTLAVANVTDTGFDIEAKITGLGGGDCFGAFVTGAVTGNAQCYNPGQPHPPKPKAFSGPVSGGGVGIAPGNGNIDPLTSVVTITAPSPQGFCTKSPQPTNWTVTLLSYSGVVSYEVCDLGAPTNGMCPAVKSCSGVTDPALKDSASGISVTFP